MLPTSPCAVRRFLLAVKSWLNLPSAKSNDRNHDKSSAAAPPVEMALGTVFYSVKPNDVLGRKYRARVQIGGGVYSTVWLAEDITSKSWVFSTFSFIKAHTADVAGSDLLPLKFSLWMLLRNTTVDECLNLRLCASSGMRGHPVTWTFL